MKDVQNSTDYRGITIQRVGVKDVHLPLRIVQREGDIQQVLGIVTLTAELPHNFKGTHMSRFMEVLMKWSQTGLSSRQSRRVLEEVASKLEAERVEMSVAFKYFLKKKSPVSGLSSVLDYDCEFTSSLNKDHFDFVLGVRVPVTSVCPCSKEIAKYGAHNQRAIISIRLRSHPYLWIEDVVEKAESLGSCEIYPLLKREDEKYVTEQAYENPKFVEDILRDAVLALREDPRIYWFEVECESLESIHNHSVYAYHTEVTRK
ncbi:MAG: GTP cyclohydrolase I FolE2 [Firmicutes bacterium]|nr:GTP cyclohydrolase I FolE2 [Bacillota bacterium]